MPKLLSELATRVFFVTQKEIWKINVQKDGERKSFYSKLPGKRGQKDCAAKAAAWLLSDLPLSLSDKTTVDTIGFNFLSMLETNTSSGKWKFPLQRAKS